ncbi:hypothetical protein Sme01_39360 [Sphaerisporangium melleum]|uniref:Uncharacterized protein n=1 Tax=Sphaerisporangium melleum TaxID=321316 RepID=A0A917R3W7_9ACTN|nr:hypothetical protein [Sphaerisporangium melleum]GGK86057.1 hypothetical protein GCM10007964_30780 [Sphaerisporangium melleum]GII71460.1 hypothetical protein Sme01_39360 [Sphaerisporangium melleum]
MRKNIQFAGFLLAAMGISGAIDHLAVQPIAGVVLNVVNRVVIPRVGFLAGYELYANLSVAALGIILIIAAASRPH